VARNAGGGGDAFPASPSPAQWDRGGIFPFSGINALKLAFFK